MKRLLFIFYLIPIFLLNGQKIGDFAKEKPNIDFPNNALGIDLMIGEGGFGFGSFYRYSFSNTFTGFVDFSMSEFKHQKEIERFDIFGYPLPIFGKKNRVFILPLNFGGQYRLFYESLTDNLRPYVALGIGPTLIVTTPAQEEFFKSFGKAKAQFGAGGYVGFGANFGLSSNNLTGINLRYYFIQLFNDGVEQYFDEYKKSLQQVSLTINIGIMY
jgi:hypothetical protein